MPFAAEIVRSWRQPRAVLRRRLAGPAREDRALACLLAACAVMFLARWPALARAAAEDPSVPLEARLGGALLAIVFLAPLLFYALAAVSHLLARGFGGQGSFYRARVALFWALLAVSPAMLLQALAAPVLVDLTGGAGGVVLGLAILLAFLAIWGAGLRVAEFERDG